MHLLQVWWSPKIISPLSFIRIFQPKNWVIISKFFLPYCNLASISRDIPVTWDNVPGDTRSDHYCPAQHRRLGWHDGSATGPQPGNVGRHQHPVLSLWWRWFWWGTEELSCVWLSVRIVSGWQSSSPAPAPVTQGPACSGPGPIVTGVSHDDSDNLVTGCW